MQELKYTTSTQIQDFSKTVLKAPIFIVGSGRSGTTFLRRILKKHPDIYTIEGETHIFSPESNPYLGYLNQFQQNNDVDNLTLTLISAILFGHECTELFARRKQFPKDVIEIHNKLKEHLIFNKETIFHDIFNFCINHITLSNNKKRWVEKTPNNIFKIPDILSVYPTAKFIEVCRDPRATFFSWKSAEQDYFKQTNIFDCIGKWNKTFEYAQKYIKDLPGQFYKLKYEDLLNNSKEELTKLYHYLNEDFDISMLDITSASSNFDHTANLDIWKRGLTSYEKLLIDIKTKKYRDQTNYECYNIRLNILNAIPFSLFYVKKTLEQKENLRFIIKLADKIISPVRFLFSLLANCLRQVNNWVIKILSLSVKCISITMNLTIKFAHALIKLINKVTCNLVKSINTAIRKSSSQITSVVIKSIYNLTGRLILLTNKNIGIANELLQSILRKQYSVKRKFKTLYWVTKRRQKIQKYLNTNTAKKLHIGAGYNMLEGWLNCNIMPITKTDIFLDASIRFPFNDNTFDYIFSEHQVEHLSYKEGLNMLKECFRILKPGGKIRITTPSLEFFIALYKKDLSKVEKEYVNYTIQRCFSGLKQNKEVFTINNVFTNFGHRFIYDQNTLKSSLETNNFIEIKFYESGFTDEDTFKDIEQHPKMFKSFGFNNGEELSQFDSFAIEAKKSIQ
ncbi:MAG: sulfotransferase [Candidatus Melainabacteria bacterium]|nr:sulfotransferase [Candidatus Melainabacteria bacterium]